MKTGKLVFGLTAFILAGSLTLTSCKKKQKEEEEVRIPNKEPSPITT